MKVGLRKTTSNKDKHHATKENIISLAKCAENANIKGKSCKLFGTNIIRERY